MTLGIYKFYKGKKVAERWNLFRKLKKKILIFSILYDKFNCKFRKIFSEIISYDLRKEMNR